MLPRSNPLFDSLLAMFETPLKHQSESRYLDIRDGADSQQMLVPFWDWQAKVSDVRALLHDNRDDEDIRFNWGLIKDVLEYSRCVITNLGIEITPNSIPIDVIRSFHEAGRRVFMSATLADDTPFVTHFGVDFQNTKIITPDSASDIGERLIVVPQAITPSITDDDIRHEVKKIATKHNVVVIVPSRRKAEDWDVDEERVVDKENISETVLALKKGHVGLVVFINRYDGVDLPHLACELLVLDGLPDVRTGYDQIEEGVLSRSLRIQNQFIQRVEQGMGRAVRSTTDYCAVVLMGKRLIGALYADRAKHLFSSATLKQFELSETVCDGLRDKSIETIFALLTNVFDRNPEWIELSKKVLVKIKYDQTLNIDPLQKVEHDAFNFVRRGDYQKAVTALNDHQNGLEDQASKGWILQKVAEYLNFYDRLEAQSTMKAAKKLNPRVLNPIDGIIIERRARKLSSQARQFVENSRQEGLDYNTYCIKVNSILVDLVFASDTANAFEEAIKNLGKVIGFFAQRPEKDTGRGPDDLWQIGNQEFLIIECKNGAQSQIISKKDCNQLNGSIEWFGDEYGKQGCIGNPLMIHVGHTFGYAAFPNPGIRIMTRKTLDVLKSNVHRFACALNASNFDDVNSVSDLLRVHGLRGEDIFTMYSVVPKKGTSLVNTRFVH